MRLHLPGMVLLVGLAVGCGDSGSENAGGSGGEGGGGAAGGMGGAGGGLPVCGNGIQEPDEVCDDGNASDDDGCSANCQSASCLVPVTHPSVQAGIDDTDCPTVWVSSGTYEENLTIGRDVVLEGVGATPAVVDGGANGTTATVSSGTVTMRTLTLTNGQAEMGGGIYNAGSLTLELVVVIRNRSVAEIAQGGGIYNDGGALTLDGTLVSANRAEAMMPSGDDLPAAHGGGIASNGGTLTVANASLVEGNTVTGAFVEVTGRGAGIYGVGSDVTLSGGSRVERNSILVDGVTGSSTAEGGGVYAEGSTVTLREASGIDGNTARAEGGSDQSSVARGGGVYLADGALSLQQGCTLSSNAAAASVTERAAASGGGIYLSASDLQLFEVVAVGNEAVATSDGTGTDDSFAIAEGGLLYAVGGSPPGEVLLRGTRVTGNRATARTESSDSTGQASGGALYLTSVSATGAEFGIDAVMQGCVVDGNEATADGTASGGAVRVEARTGADISTALTVASSTLSNNRATSSDGNAFGGAAYVNANTGSSYAALFATNTTISSNECAAVTGMSVGGGIYGTTSTGSASAEVALHSSTITANAANGPGAAGGIYLRQGVQDSITNGFLANTILYGNTASTSPECATDGTSIESLDYNLFGATTGCTISGTAGSDITGSDPQLAPLADNGGATETHALGPASPAIDQGNPGGCVDTSFDALAFDQRGEDRNAGGRCDMGAFESQ